MAAENFKVKKGLEVGTAITATSSGVNVTGVVTATQFVGDGSGLTGVTAAGSGVVVQEEGSNVGTAATINFIGSNVTAAISGGVASVTVGGGSLNNVVDDTTPQLGGNLDLDGKFINGTGGANITGVVTATTGDFVNLDVDGETELDDVNITGFTTFATGTRFFQHIPRIEMQGGNTAQLQLTNATSGTTLNDGMVMGFSSSSQVGFINVNESAHGFVLKTSGNATTAERINISGVGTVSIRKGTTEEMITARPDGAVELYFDGNKRLETSSVGVSIPQNLDVDGQTDLDDVVVAGVSTFNDGITLGTNSTTFAAKFADDAVANFGTDNDLQISHDNSNALIRNSTGKVVVVGVVSATSGANITGVVTATTFSGSGASLTNLPSGQLSGALPALDGSALTGVTASGTGIVVKHDGTTVGTAGTVNFSTNLDVTAVSAGIVTITASGGSGITTENVVTDSLVVSGVSTLTDSLRVGGHLTLTGTPHTYYYGRGTQDGGLSVYSREAAIEVVGDDDGGHGGSVLIRTPTEGFGFVINPSTNSLELKAFTSTSNDFAIHNTGSNVSDLITQLRVVKDEAVELYHNGSKKFETTQTGVDITGIATATTFSGSLDASNLTGTIANGRFPATLPAVSGANLTNLNADNISSGTLASARIEDEAITFAKMQHVGTGVFIGRNDGGSGDIETLTAAEARTLLNVADGANVGITTTAWTVSNNGSSNYVISGPGGLSSANNPDLYLERGQTYQFIVNASGHPFGIQTISGTWTGNDAYTTGITNPAAAVGTITFAVPYSAPAQLYYACTAQHGGMVGNIYIRGAAGGEINVGVTTFSSTVTATEFVPTLAQLAHRNRIHNGGMTIAQRIGDTETTLTHNNWTQTLDRWKVYENTEAVLTATRTHGSYPTAGTNPSSYSAQRLKVTTADTSIGSSQQCMLAQIIEGFNWQDLRWGTSAAKTVTLSFSVLATGAAASNVTGTYCVQCTNASNYDRAYIREYTIDAVNVWKRVTLTFPGDTSGTWDKGTDQACRFAWFLAAGTDHHGSANSWGSFKATTSNQKNFLGYVNNFIFITDVQVEEGTLATPFETKPFTTELQLCQRYYVKDTMTREGSGHGVVTGALDSIVGIQVDFPVTMRATPNLTLNGTTYRTGGNADAERISPTGFIWGRKQTGSGTFNGAAYATGGYEVSAEY